MDILVTIAKSNCVPINVLSMATVKMEIVYVILATLVLIVPIENVQINVVAMAPALKIRLVSVINNTQE